jgi:5-methyltetrahydrofolate--homocysteine methyltransferase
MARFENVRVVQDSATAFDGLTVEESLKKHIVDGVKKGLESRLQIALQSYSPIQIINELLLDGMKTVGDLFGSGKMQLPFVLQSAEVMKAAVKFLEPHMERLEGSEKGSIVLATVAGDVHDIGKNLVDIILTNNGYRVVNIGIKQPINAIIDAWQASGCQAIGMSGLLVKSTLIMKENLIELNNRGLSHIPVLLGGAALTRSYVEQDLSSIYRGKVFYAQDAFDGLRIMEQLQAPAEPVVAEETDAELPRVRSHRLDTTDPELYVYSGIRSNTEPVDPPALPFYGARAFDRFDIFELYKYINPIALFRGQWQFRRPEGMGNQEFNSYLAEHAEPVFKRLQRELARVLEPKVVWGYFPCNSSGNYLIIYQDDGKTERTRFRFPRQRDGKYQCLSDFFQPVDGPVDTVGFHLVTVGSEVSEYERKLFAEGNYQDYLFVHGMGVETAEALAEYWHRQIRFELGIADQEPDDMKLLFSAKYHGARYSFGYPACPNLEDQTQLFELLNPSQIGVELSPEFMLVPEQSTSAIIVHHPKAKYFNIR